MKERSRFKQWRLENRLKKVEKEEKIKLRLLSSLPFSYQIYGKQIWNDAIYRKLNRPMELKAYKYANEELKKYILTIGGETK